MCVCIFFIIIFFFQGQSPLNCPEDCPFYLFLFIFMAQKYAMHGLWNTVPCAKPFSFTEIFEKTFLQLRGGINSLSKRFQSDFSGPTVIILWSPAFVVFFFYHWGLAAECTEEVITLCVIRNQVWIKPDCIWAGWSYDAVGQPHNFNFHYGTKLILSLIYFLLLFHSSSNAMQSWHIPQLNEIPLHELLENRTGNYTQWAW